MGPIVDPHCRKEDLYFYGGDLSAENVKLQNPFNRFD